MLLDVDECAEDTSGCTQTCTNTVGSYECSCDYGYRIASDNHGCNGKSNRYLTEDYMSIVNMHAIMQ